MEEVENRLERGSVGDGMTVILGGIGGLQKIHSKRVEKIDQLFLV
jgi:hypothetical protein